MTFIEMIKLIFKRDEKPTWYKSIPWHKRFNVWKSSYANPINVIKYYMGRKRNGR